MNESLLCSYIILSLFLCSLIFLTLDSVLANSNMIIIFLSLGGWDYHPSWLNSREPLREVAPEESAGQAAETIQKETLSRY